MCVPRVFRCQFKITKQSFKKKTINVIVIFNFIMQDFIFKKQKSQGGKRNLQMVDFPSVLCKQGVLCHIATDQPLADIINVTQPTLSLCVCVCMCACWEVRKGWWSGATCHWSRFPFHFPLWYIAQLLLQPSVPRLFHKRAVKENKPERAPCQSSKLPTKPGRKESYNGPVYTVNLICLKRAFIPLVKNKFLDTLTRCCLQELDKLFYNNASWNYSCEWKLQLHAS